MKIALLGNPNCGKTTLFNKLTNTYQRVGNWTGVTVEKKIGEYSKDKSINIIDLPGIYSLRAKMPEEKACVESLINDAPDVIINVIDATSLEKSLYLTCELCSMSIPFVVALNMCDELDKNGIKINLEKLSKAFNVPIIEVSALKNINIDKLVLLAKNSIKVKGKIHLRGYNNLSLSEKYYAFIEDTVSICVTKKRTRTQIFTQKADKILMSGTFGIPIFFLVMTMVYYLSINIGGVFGNLILTLFERLSIGIESKMLNLPFQVWQISLTKTIFSSMGGVLSFLPQILILFTLLAVIEDSGYASRASFLFDRFFRSFGLGGKSLMPMIVSCGCTVPGLMSTRIIDGDSERKMTIFLSPFMPCGAKTAVFAWFSQVFFNGNAFVASSMYLLSVFSIGFFGKILKKLKPFNRSNNGFIMEIPTLKVPSINNVFKVMQEKLKEFITKAGLTIFVVSVFVWLFKSVGRTGYVGDNIEKSFLYDFGNFIKWLFYPLGFGSWQASVGVVSGIFAKEAIIETLEIISLDVNTIFYCKYSAYAFMAFVLLSPPCIASLVTAKKELGNIKWFLFMCLFQFLSAYFVALFINVVGFLICAYENLILSLLFVIITTLAVVLAINFLKKHKCLLCANRCKGEIKCHKKAKRFTI